MLPHRRHHPGSLPVPDPRITIASAHMEHRARRGRAARAAAAMRTCAASTCARWPQLMSEDGPDLILLQEVPVWAGPLLREHTGMGVTLAPCLRRARPVRPRAAAAGGRRRGGPRAARPGAHPVRGPGERVAVRPRPAAGLGPPRAAERAPAASRRAADRPARAAAPPPGRPRVRGGQRARRPRRQQAAAGAGRLPARAVRPRRADGAGRRHERAGRARRACARSSARGWVEESSDVRIDHVFVRGFDIEWPATRWTAVAPRPVAERRRCPSGCPTTTRWTR